MEASASTAAAVEATPEALFRIVARHPNRGHHDHAWAAIGPVFDDQSEAVEAIDSVKDEHREDADRRGESLDVDERVRMTLAHRLAELEVLGHEFKVQQLYAIEFGEDDAGQRIATAHEWRDVS